MEGKVFVKHFEYQITFTNGCISDQHNEYTRDCRAFNNLCNNVMGDAKIIRSINVHWILCRVLNVNDTLLQYTTDTRQHSICDYINEYNKRK